MRTIESFEDYFDPIQEAIDDILLPKLFGEREPLPSDLRQLVTLPRSRRARGTRLTVGSPTAVCCFYVNTSTARRFYYHIQYVHGGRREFHGRVKKTTSSLQTASVKSRMESIDSTLPWDLLPSVNQSRDKGASSWFTAVPLVDQGLVLNKQEFSAFKV